MILDTRTQFCDGVSLDTSGTGTVLLGDVIDLSAADLDLGQGEPLYLVLQATEDAASSNSTATVQFALVSDDSADIATDGTQTTLIETAEFSVDEITDGTRLACIALPSGDYEEFLGIQQITGTEAVSAGAVDAFLTLDPTGWKAYPDGI